jgi:hypothetical protein
MGVSGPLLRLGWAKGAESVEPALLVGGEAAVPGLEFGEDEARRAE